MTNISTQQWEGLFMSFGERVRQIRTEQGLTAKELSNRSGVPEKTIYRVETGQVEDPRLSTIEGLVRGLECSADELLFNPGNFNKLGNLRQLLLNFGEMSEEQQDLLLEVINRIKMSFMFESVVSSSLQKVSGKDEGGLPPQ